MVVANAKNATMNAQSSAHDLRRPSVSAELEPPRLTACQVRASVSPWPVSVSVPRISSAALDAMNVAAIVKLRSVCTAITSRLGFAITCSTQRVRAVSLTPWIVKCGSRRARRHRSA